jgi:hypothetical protein
MVGKSQQYIPSTPAIYLNTPVCHIRTGAYEFTNSLEQQDKAFRPGALTPCERRITLRLAHWDSFLFRVH